MKKFLVVFLCLLSIMSSMLSKNIVKADGKFHGKFESEDEEIYYQFKSNDDVVWWVLTENEIGFIPENNTEYILIYNNNGTTKDNKVCDCSEDYECECYVYDDVFIKVIEKR